MDYATFIEHLEADGAEMIAVAAGGPDRPVPSCPGWDVTQLMLHVGETYRDIVFFLRQGGTERHEPPEVKPPDARDSDAVISWVRTGLDDLVEVLRHADPDDPAYSWAGDHRTAFWARRMALETAVHRWDAQAALGAPRPVDSDLGADCVDEMFEVHIRRDGGVYSGRAGTVHLHRTDGEGEWVVSLRPGALPAARRAHEHSDVAARGSGSELALLLWRRISPSDLQLHGDADLLGEFWDYLSGPGE